MRLLAAEIGNDTHFCIGLYGSADSRLAPDPGVTPISPDDQRGGQNTSILQAQRCAALADIKRLGNRRTEKGHVVLALQAFPQFHVHQAGLADPSQFAHPAFVGSEAQRATRIPVYLHLCNRGKSRVVQVRPNAEVRKKCRAGGTICVNSLIPAVRSARRPLLDQRNPEAAAAKRNGHGRASKSATDDDEVELHVILI